MSFEVEHKGAIVVVEDCDGQSISIEDVVNPETGEVLTEDWFESGDIYDQNLRDKIKDKRNESKIDSFIDQL